VTSNVESTGAVGALASGLPLVVLAGRANAGKSTLFNRIAHYRRAIVSPVPGTTRDLNAALVEHEGRKFTLVDSGGLELNERQGLTERVVAEALRAAAAADVIIFVVDGRAGLNPADQEALGLIREVGRPLMLAVNKLDVAGLRAQASEFHALGVENIFPLSAAHGTGVAELLDAAVARLPSVEESSPPPPALRVALLGRPNAGKSSLLNRLVGGPRAIVDAVPGTTRDPLDVRIKLPEGEILLIDTAGIRRPARIEGEIEHEAVRRAIETIRRAEVLLLTVDASEGLTDQDARLAHLVEREDRALILVVNKWDLAAAAGSRQAAFTRDLRERFSFLESAPLLFTSALTGDGVTRLLPAALVVGQSYRAQFQTARLNQILAAATQAMDPPVVAGRRLKLLYVTQVASSPPRLMFFSNLERDLPVHYLRFLENRFRQALDLRGTPLRLMFRRRGGARGAAVAAQTK
jgi:GTP-binding protein